ncbi:MAG TPA: LysR substrate-binding domain-containing protein [Gammaproteobacteria bacterium]|nr:LysR substrate-binding domain-containing protein [Gammaproteobacteria bacterium]
MRDLPLNALRAFASVYAHGGIRAAARELGVAHSSISRHLKELEAWTGTPLTRESTGRRGLAFTQQGEALGKATLAGLREITHAADAVREARSATSVVLSTTPSFAARWLLPRLPALEATHPDLEVSVIVDQKLSNLDGGAIDVAVRIGKGPWPGLDCEPLMDDALYPVMSPAFWQKSRRPAKPAQLARLRLLHDRDPQAAWVVWRDACGPPGLDVRAGPRFASSDILLRAAMQGQGVALARHRLASDDVAAGALLRPLGALSVTIAEAYWIVRPRQTDVRPAVAAVIDWLKEQAHA